MNLYDYQQRCLESLRIDFAQGHKSLLVQAATGVGKSVILLAWINNNLKPGQRALILAHRKELITQPIDKARRFFPKLARKMGIVMGDQNDADAQVVVATVQTLNSEGRLDEVLSHGAFNLYVVDEAHHDSLATPTYRFVEDRLRQANPDLLKTGWTATPTRTDQNGLVTVDGVRGTYDKKSFSYPVQTAVREGALCEFSAHQVGLPVHIPVDERGEWADDEILGDILNADNIWEIVLDVWHGKGSVPDCSKRSTIVFTASVAQAIGGAAYFRKHGIKAESVSGMTPKDEREAILERLKSGQTSVVFNCMVLTEGFDAPNVSCTLMVSPTKSALVWTQKAGRVLRKDPNNPNKHAIIVDFYPIERDGMVFAADAFGVPQQVKKGKEKAEDAGVLVSGWSVDRFGRAVSVDTDRIVAKMLDLMSKSALPWTLSGHKATTALAKDSAACVVLPDSKRIEKAERLRTSGKWTERHERLYDFIRKVRLYAVRKNGWRWTAELVNLYDEPDAAKKSVDSWPRDRKLGARAAHWREKDITIDQIRKMRSLRVDIPDKCKRGEASRLISEALTLQATEQAEQRLEKEMYNG